MWVGVRPSADAKGPLLRAGVLGGVRGALLLLPMRPLQTLLGGRRPCYHGSLPASPTPPSRDPRGRLAAGASVDTARPPLPGARPCFLGARREEGVTRPSPKAPVRPAFRLSVQVSAAPCRFLSSGPGSARRGGDKARVLTAHWCPRPRGPGRPSPPRHLSESCVYFINDARDPPSR